MRAIVVMERGSTGSTHLGVHTRINRSKVHHFHRELSWDQAYWIQRRVARLVRQGRARLDVASSYWIGWTAIID